jgi:hypothetical protein
MEKKMGDETATDSRSKPVKICKIEGCDLKVLARGWCMKHYERWRNHGDPLGGRTENGEPLAFLEAHRDYKEPTCLVWPYSTNGYGYGCVKISGRTRKAHVIMLELTQGPKPSPRHEAAHNCGHRICINPRHLRWATRAENQGDRVQHGTHSRGEQCCTAILTENDVQQIRALLAAGKKQTEIAAQFNISRSNVSRIKRGLNWSWLH